MAKILVFRTDDKPEDEDSLSLLEKNELDIIYKSIKDELIDDTKTGIDGDDIEEYSIKQFQQMEIEVGDMKRASSKGIPTIMAKELLKYITPLIAKIPATYSYGQVISKKFKKPGQKPQPEAPTRLAKYVLTLQNEENTPCVLFPMIPAFIKKYDRIKFKQIIVPANTMFSMIGFALPLCLGVPNLDASIFNKSMMDDIRMSNAKDFMATGNFTNTSTSNTNFSTRTVVDINMFDDFSHTLTNYSGRLKSENITLDKKKYKIVIFSDDADAMKKMNILLTEINRIRMYYKNTYMSVFKTIEFNPFTLPKLDGKITGIKAHTTEKEYRTVKSSAVSELVDKYILDEKTGVFNDSLYNMLRQQNMLILANKVRIKGAQNFDVRKILAQIKFQNNVKTVLKIQDHQNIAYDNKISVKQVLAEKKFGADSNYNLLSAKDKKTVDVAYNIWNDMNTQNVDVFEKKKSISIRKFYNAFNELYPIESLKIALKDLEMAGLGPKKTINENLKYGLCEHNLTKAKLIIEGKKDFEIKKILINKYVEVDVEMKYPFDSASLAPRRGAAHTTSHGGKAAPKKAKKIVKKKPVEKKSVKKKAVSKTKKSARADTPKADQAMTQKRIEETMVVSKTSTDPGKKIYEKPEYGNYCHLCGERIYKVMKESIVLFVEGKLKKSADVFDPLEDHIYKEVSYIIRIALKFKDSALADNLKGIVRSFVSVLRPEMGIIEARYIKIKTNIGDNLKDIMTIYITIYTYALICQMIIMNYGQITFASRPKRKPRSAPSTGGNRKIRKVENKLSEPDSLSGHNIADIIKTMKVKGEKKGSSFNLSNYSLAEINETMKKAKGGKTEKKARLNQLQNILSNAYYLIITTKSSLLRRVTVIKREDIKPLLIKAYKWAAHITMITDKDTIVASDEKRDLASILMGNPTYFYLWYMRHMLSPNVSIIDVKDILGRSLDEIEKQKEEKNLFETASIVTEKEFESKIASKSDKDGKDASYKKYLIDYIYASYDLIMKYNTTKIYDETAVPLSAVLAKYYDDWKEINIMNTAVRYTNLIKHAPSIWVPNYGKYGTRRDNDPSLVKLNMAKIYRRNGQLHNWDVYVFKKIYGSGKKELTQKEMTKILRNGIDIHKQYRLVDKKDSVTGEYLSRVRDYSAEIKKNREKRYDVIGFFEYFENRCPVLGLHTVTGKTNACSKCGMTGDQNKMKWSSTPQGKKYYTKYLKVFNSQKQELSQVIKQQLIDVKHNINVKKQSRVYTNVPMLLEKDRPTEAKVLEWSRKTKTSFNLLSNIGLSTGLKFSKILKGEINPSKNKDTTSEEFKTQLLRLDVYYNDIIYKYYLIKQYQSQYELPQDIVDLIENNTKTTKNMQKSMPDIFDPSYHNKFIQYEHSNQTPKIVAAYILNKIASTMMDITRVMSKTKFKNFGDVLVNWFTKEIISKEKIFSLPDPFKYTVDKRAEKGDAYASSSSEAESIVGDMSDLSDTMHSPIASSASELMTSEDGEDEGRFGLEESDILERNMGED